MLHGRHPPLGCPSAPCDEARLADRSGAKQFTKTLCFWRVVGGLTACDRLVEGEVSQEAFHIPINIQEIHVAKCIVNKRFSTIELR